MKNVATVTSKGQITVPLEVRTHLGLREGDRVEFLTENGVTVIRPSRGEGNPFAAFAGILGTFPRGVDDINTWVRDLRDDEARAE
jgi:AbrB family looped-hinge helix DNA binding protein